MRLHTKTLAQHTAVIESDEGAGRALGVTAAVSLESFALLQPLASVLRPIGANVLERSDRARGADISVLEAAGVPGFSPLLDARTPLLVRKVQYLSYEASEAWISPCTMRKSPKSAMSDSAGARPAIG